MLWQELELDSTRANDELVLLQVDAALVPPHVVKAKDALRAVLLLQHCHGCRDVLVTYLHTGLLVPYLHCTGHLPAHWSTGPLPALYSVFRFAPYIVSTVSTLSTFWPLSHRNQQILSTICQHLAQNAYFDHNFQQCQHLRSVDHICQQC